LDDVWNWENQALRRALKWLYNEAQYPADGDDKSYLFNLPTTIDGAVVYGAVAMRSRTHEPGTGFTERAEIQHGSNSAMAAIAVKDMVVPSATTVAVNGTFNGDVDWAVVALEIKPESEIPLTTDPSGKKTRVASAFQLHNYPNPFNAQTNIEYLLRKPGQTRLLIYNLNGQRVRTLVEAMQSAGHHKVQWNGRDEDNREMGSGVYLMQLEAGAQRLARRIILLK
jgi:hypothetical protein